MATVYLARQAAPERYVALKELSNFDITDRQAAQRFVREAQFAGSLNHPNIVTVHEYFEDGAVPYIAMEYAERGSLRPYVGCLSLPQIAGVLEGVLAGLAHAEQIGIVHRDLKPENLMVTEEGRIKITDFGIAKATIRAGMSTFLTKEGMTVGTPIYMAPEQAIAADQIGPWTDLYSVGVMAYEHIVGHPPFRDEPTPVILFRHVNDRVPSASEVSPAVPPALSAWIDRMLVKSPTERTQGAAEAWDSLEDIVIDLLGPRWRRDARLGAQMLDTNGAKPLTPAPFQSTRTPTPRPSEAPPASDLTARPTNVVEPPSTEAGRAGADEPVPLPDAPDVLERAALETRRPAAEDAAAAAAATVMPSDGPEAAATTLPPAAPEPAATIIPPTTPDAPATIIPPAEEDPHATRFTPPEAEPETAVPAEVDPWATRYTPPESEAANPPAEPATRPEENGAARIHDATTLPPVASRAPDAVDETAPEQREQDAAAATAPAVEKLQPYGGRTATAPVPPEPVIRRRRLVAAGVAVGVVAVIAVVAVLLLGGSSSAKQSAQSGPITVKYASAWRPVSQVAFAGAALSGSASAATPILASQPAPIQLASDGVDLAAGSLVRSAAVPGGVPPALQSKYGHPTASVNATISGAPVREYQWTLGARGELDAYIVPTTAGDLAIMCSAPGPAVARLHSCTTLASAATVTGAQLLTPGPDSSLSADVTRGVTAAAGARGNLKGLQAGKLSDRASAAQGIAKADASAASSLAAVSVPARYQHSVAALESALRAEGTAFSALAAAAQRNDGNGYTAAGKNVMTASQLVAAAASTLRADGLTLPALASLKVPGVPAPPKKKAAAPASSTPSSSGSSGGGSQSSTPSQSNSSPTYTPSAPTYTPPSGGGGSTSGGGGGGSTGGGGGGSTGGGGGGTGGGGGGSTGGGGGGGSTGLLH